MQKTILFLGSVVSSCFFSIMAIAGTVGDINSDGKVDLQEAIYALQVSSGSYPNVSPSCQLEGEGNWIPTAFNECDVVNHNGSYYICNDSVGCTSGDEPGLSPKWDSLMLHSEWVRNGDNLYYDSGYIGIGTPDPLEMLHLNDSSEDAIIFVDTMGSGNNAMITFHTGWRAVSLGLEDGGEQGETLFHITNGDRDLVNDMFLLTIRDAGEVGIGTTLPNSKLDVQGISSYDRNGIIRSTVFPEGSDSVGQAVAFFAELHGDVNDTGGAYDAFTAGDVQSNGSLSDFYAFRVEGGYSTALQIQSGSIDYLMPNLKFKTYGGEEVLTMTDSGNVGIGTSTPASKLSVAGLPTSPPDGSGNAGVVCVTNDGNFWLDDDGTNDCI